MRLFVIIECFGIILNGILGTGAAPLRDQPNFELLRPEAGSRAGSNSNGNPEYPGPWAGSRPGEDGSLCDGIYGCIGNSANGGFIGDGGVENGRFRGGIEGNPCIVGGNFGNGDGSNGGFGGSISVEYPGFCGGAHRPAPPALDGSGGSWSIQAGGTFWNPGNDHGEHRHHGNGNGTNSTAGAGNGDEVHCLGHSGNGGSSAPNGTNGGGGSPCTPGSQPAALASASSSHKLSLITGSDDGENGGGEIRMASLV